MSDTGIGQVIPSFYTELPATTFRRGPLIGQFYWVVAPFLTAVPWIYDVQRADPTEHTVATGKIRPIDKTDFRPKSRLPIKVLSLRETEELLIHRSKKRLAVVISARYTIFDDIAAILRQRGQRHLQEDSVIVVPLYGVENKTHSGGFPAGMTAKIQALQYRQFFYCPGHAVVKEGVLRLDRLQPVLPHQLSIEPTQVALHPEALSVLLTMVRALFGAPLDEDFIALQSLLRETLPS
jgi:hypothetical protein